MRPWKTLRDGITLPTPSRLQWGHGDEAVEDGSEDESGNVKLSLQWGHGDEAVEDDRFAARDRGHGWLQWGHGDEAVEDARLNVT